MLIIFRPFKSGDYVEAGGLLVLTNSAARLGPFARPRESNEDWNDINAIARAFGIEFSDQIAGSEAEVTGSHDKIEAFESMLRPHGLLEMVRTGEVALARGAD